MTDKKPIPRIRFVLYAIITFGIIPLCAIGLLEGGLRWADYGYDAAFTIKSEGTGVDIYKENFNFGWKYFSRKIVRFTYPFQLTHPKKPKTYRIFVMGGSAAAGFPQPMFGFSRILETLIKDQFPDANIEIINTATDSFNSHVLYEVAKNLTRFEGDLFIIYAGNNEVTGPFGPGTIFVPALSHLSLIRATTFIQSMRIGQLLQSMVLSIKKNISDTPTFASEEEFNVFFRNVLDQKQIRVQDPQLKKVYNYFRKNLNDIIRLLHRSGAQTVLCTVGCNLKDFAPFASLPRRESFNETWNDFFEQGIAHHAAGNLETAVEKYLKAIDIDGNYAEIHFRLGRCYEQLKQLEKAQKHYVRARDLDTLRFRIDSTMNDIIRTVAQKNKSQGVFLFDSVAMFKNKSPQGIPGKELFYEYVHMNFKGNYLMAKELFWKIEPLLPLEIRKKQKQKPLLSMKECAQNLAYTDFARFEIANKYLQWFTHPPFTNMLNYSEIMDYFATEVQSTNVLNDPKVLEDAERQHRLALQENPMDPWIHFSLGRILLFQQRPKEAISHFQFVLSQMPGYIPVEEFLYNAEDMLWEMQKNSQEGIF